MRIVEGPRFAHEWYGMSGTSTGGSGLAAAAVAHKVFDAIDGKGADPGTSYAPVRLVIRGSTIPRR